MGFEIVAGLILLFGVALIAAGVKAVGQGHEWTVERFGRYTRTLSPGLHVIVPVMDHIGRKVKMMEQVLDISSQEVISKDNAMVRVNGVVFFQVIDAAKASYEVNSLQYAIQNLTMTNIRSVLGALDLDNMLSERDQINARLLDIVDRATSPWGVKITRIEIKDIEPPQDLISAMANQMKAEREKRAAVLEAEGERQAAILRAEGEKQSAILEAEGRKEAAFRDAEAREREASAEAKATEMVSQSIAQGNVNAVNYFVAQKYVGALEQLASADNQKVILMPMEASGILGALSGVTELLSTKSSTESDERLL